jgi:hypothetical protein
VPVDQNQLQLHTLRAALGWLELGLPREALEELDRLPEELLKKNADVLEVRWMILAQMKNWDEALITSCRLVAAAPDRASSWLHQAYATRRAIDGGLENAYGILSGIVTDFPDEPTIPYNLACYTCQLKRPPEETMQWFERALAVGKPSELIEMALRDDDLAPVRSLIEQLTTAKKRR